MSRYRTAPDPRACGAAILPQQPDWFRQAACAGMGHELFFGPASDLPPEERETAEEKVAREERALAVCRSCPVMQRCRAYIDRFRIGDQYGTWGGTTKDDRERQRRAAQRQAARQRRKSP